MLKPSHHRNSLRQRRTRHFQRTCKERLKDSPSPHPKSINRLNRDLHAEPGLIGHFHSGIDWCGQLRLLPHGVSIAIEREKSLVAARHRYIPDLVVRCAKTWAILLVIEVWHSHAVTERKRQDFNRAGLRWVEVRARDILNRKRENSLPILDWGGDGLPDPPCQMALFEQGDVNRPAPHWQPIRPIHVPPHPMTSWTLLPSASGRRRPAQQRSAPAYRTL